MTGATAEGTTAGEPTETSELAFICSIYRLPESKSFTPPRYAARTGSVAAAVGFPSVFSGCAAVAGAASGASE